MQSFSLLRDRLLQPLQGESYLEDFGFFKLCDNFLAAAFIKTKDFFRKVLLINQKSLKYVRLLTHNWQSTHIRLVTYTMSIFVNFKSAFFKIKMTVESRNAIDFFFNSYMPFQR